jgi:phosphoribosylamine--glycine ligase
VSGLAERRAAVLQPRVDVPRVVLVIGSGAREHALAWHVAQDAGVERVLVAPGNPLMADTAEVIAKLDPADHQTVIELCRSEAVELVIVGPEGPLVAGLVDALGASGIACLGPSAAAAQLEGSKAFCREVAEAAGVPMSEGRAFEDAEAALAYARRLGDGLVVKADGLAAGKGVTVCDSVAQAEDAIGEAMLGRRFGAAGSRVILERRLDGPEASLIALCDGRDALLLPVARDHKRLLDGDEGPNTGGMGACSPLDDMDQAAAEKLLDAFHRPVLAEMARRGAPFRGFLYAGLMLTVDGPRLLELNVRLGDPEAQAILPRIEGPLSPLLAAAADGQLASAALAMGIEGRSVPTNPVSTVALTLAAYGYPGTPRSGDRISGIDAARDRGGLVFGAGVARDVAGRLVTDGGRVLTVVGCGSDPAEARGTAYQAADEVRFDGRQLRSDIGLTITREVAIA